MAIPDALQQFRSVKLQSFWMGGMNSNLSPLLLPPTVYQCAFNMINRGGEVSVRPRHNLTYNVPGVNPQLLCLFTPTFEDVPVMVVVCDGIIYTSPWPYVTLTPLAGATLSPLAAQCFACVAQKSVRQETSGALTVIPTQSILILSDGASRAVRWDGVFAPTVMDPQPPVFGVPASIGPSVYSNGRLWCAKGASVYASDLDNPDTFTETLIVSEGGFFAFPGDVTCIIETPDRSGIIVFTASQAYFIKSSNRDRTTWQTDPTFIQTLLTGLGCAGAKAAANQFGLTYFFSPGGLLTLNTAIQTYQTSNVLYQDIAMERSKDNLSDDRSGVCIGTHEDYLLCSVPSGDLKNRHTWCLDENPGGGSPRAWSSIWTGVRPVDYASGVVNGKLRTFFLSRDYSSANGSFCNVWEAFGDNQTEPGGPVTSNMETGLFQIAPLEPTAFISAEIFLVGIEGSLRVQVSVGVNSGGYIPIMDTTVVAPRGPYDQEWVSTSNADVFDSYRPQTRILRTPQLNATQISQLVPDAAISQIQEAGDMTPIGTGRTMSLLISLTGVGGMQSIRVAQDVKPTQTTEKCSPVETSAIAPLSAADYRTEFDYQSL